MTMQDTGPMLKKYYDTLEEIKALRKKADMMKQELIGIIEFTGATSIPDPTFECKLGQTNTYDKLQWNNLVNSEVVEILPDDVAKIMPVEEMTAQQLVDQGRGKEVGQHMEWGNASTVESVCKQYGRDALRIFEASKIPGDPTLTFKLKK